MRSYREVFDTGEQVAANLGDRYKSVLPEWRQHPELFHFIMANDNLLASDYNALALSTGVSSEFTEMLLYRGASGSRETIDGVECRHILMMTYLQSQLGRNWGNVVEIGGGYGNCVRLVTGLIQYYNWTIVDLPYILELQKWFLKSEKISTNRIHFHKAAPESADLVIGSHSLSEFDEETFDSYFEFVSKAKWFFYVSHNSSPSIDLLEYKIQQINKKFVLASSMIYEWGASTMRLYKNRGLL